MSTPFPSHWRSRHILLLPLCSLGLFGSPVAVAMDWIRFDRDGTSYHLAGRILVETQDGGRLFEVPDGTFWALQPREIVRESTDPLPFEHLPQEKLAAHLLAELPDGFQVHSTARYVLCHNTSEDYAMWCGALLERLHQAFLNYWTRRDMELDEPGYALPVIVFRDRESYQRFTREELGSAAGSIPGYYSLRTNRVLMYDLTGVESIRHPARRRMATTDINRLLSRPEAASLVATIVHEATHQIAYNSGMQIRYADNPMWLSEGLAIYFETPDLSSQRGWRGIGQINRNRLQAFRQYLGHRGPDSLASLVSDDRRFQNSETVLPAYAEAWSLTYFLIHQQPEQFVAYVRRIAKKPRLVWDEPATRLDDFKQCFGDDLAALDRQFLRYIARL